MQFAGGILTDLLRFTSCGSVTDDTLNVAPEGDTQVMVILSEQDDEGCFLCWWKEGAEIRNDRFPAVVLEKVRKPTAGAFWLGKK